MKKWSWSPLDHKIWKNRSQWPPFKRVLVAFSGGIDSMVLLRIMKNLSFVGSFEVIAANVHHGPGPASLWRSECARFCEALCQEWEIEFHGVGPSPNGLKNEEELRHFRYEELRKLKSTLSCDFILTAHHADDLLETRLLRLLRGTGGQGLLAMAPFEADLGRPLLNIAKKEILDYAELQGLKPMEDPSNQELEPMRNWVRRELIPFLEARQSGLSSNLGRSLQLLVDERQESSTFGWLELKQGLYCYSRTEYLLLNPMERKRLIAEVFQRMDVVEYSHGQIDEIVKRLDSAQRVLSFKVGGLLWDIDAKQVKVQRPE